MAQTAINLAALPAPVVIEQLDYEDIVAAIKADLVARGNALTPPVNLAPALALESEPLTIAVEAFAYRELNLRNQFNLRSQANMLAYANGPDLDNLAANLDATRIAGQSDTAFRGDAVQAPSGWAVAGPLAAYEYIAQNADATVANVEVTSPTPGQVLVTVLSTAPGGVADAALLATVDAALSADTVRPFTDQVIVQSAAVTTYNVVGALSVGAGPDPTTVLSAATAAVQAYGAAQAKIGLPVRVAGIIAAMMQGGVDNAVLTSPAADIVAVAATAHLLGTVTLTTSTDESAL